jgi:Protein of unknown function (DUF1501)
MTTARQFDRRRFLQAGGLSALGLNLAGLLQARAAREAQPLRALPQRIRSCILIFQYGGPSHIDTFDMKPNAPAEVRGEWQSIATSVTGLRICEHLPRLARLMHKSALIRSMHHANRLHDSASIETLTGRPIGGPDRELFAPQPQFFPSHGGILSYLWRERHLKLPHAALPFAFHNVVDVPCQEAGFLGSAYNPFWINADVPSRGYRAELLALPADLSADRLRQRRTLLEAMEQRLAAHPGAARMRTAAGRAYQLLESDTVRRALDLSQEDLRTRERYGFYPGPATVGEGGGGGNGAELGQNQEMRGQNLLLARRLVEAGVPFVNAYDYKQQGQNWDAHFKVFNQHKKYLLPAADRGISALIEDLDARGLLDTTLVIAMGEFGRTPRINKEGGRDHWPDCYTVFLAGGGVKGGYVHGGSDRLGGYPADDPVTPADLAATIFWRFGIDPATEVHDMTGRPYRIAEGQPITRLFENS